MRFQNRSQNVDSVVKFFVFEARKNGQRQNSVICSCSTRKVSRMITEGLSIIRLHVQRQVVDTGTDAAFIQTIAEFVTANAETLEVKLNNVEVPGV